MARERHSIDYSVHAKRYLNLIAELHKIGNKMRFTVYEYAGYAHPKAATSSRDYTT